MLDVILQYERWLSVLERKDEAKAIKKAAIVPVVRPTEECAIQSADDLAHFIKHYFFLLH